MSVEDLQKAEQALRTVELPRAIRGVDPEQARKLLGEAADSLATAVSEQKELHRELERLRQTNDEDAIGKALLTATRAGEEVLAEAHKEAASITAKAEAEASALLEQVATQAKKREQETAAAREQFERELTAAKNAHAKEHESARAEADAALADARRELAQLENQAGRLRSLVTDMERRIVEIAESALEELVAFDTSTSSETENDLLADLQPAAEPSDITAD
jgi:cell division septum initiation protein DivIVA